VTCPGSGAVAAGPGTVSRRPDSGRVGPGRVLWGIWSAGAGTRQAQLPGGLTAYGRGDSLLEAAWSRQFIYVYSFMRIRHLGFFLIDLFSDYKTDRQTDIHFSLGSRSYGFVAIISGISLQDRHTFLQRKPGPLLWLCRSSPPGLPVSH
jgi:hypothetical protein